MGMKVKKLPIYGKNCCCEKQIEKIDAQYLEREYIHGMLREGKIIVNPQAYYRSNISLTKKREHSNITAVL